MKSIIFSALLFFAFSSKAAICGYTQRDLIKLDSIQMILQLPGETAPSEVTIVPPQDQETQDFIVATSVHGAAICKPFAVPEAGFKICYEQDADGVQVTRLYCGHADVCTGFACSGNGFSVNSRHGF